MTVIGAIRCGDGVVLLADGQETITDYAKWSVNKIKSVELNGQIRIVMTGAGDSDSIEMIWEKVSELWESNGSPIFVSWRADYENKSVQEWRQKIVSIVHTATMESIIPWGATHAGVSLIWMIEDISKSLQMGSLSFELFRTSGLHDNNIRDFHFDGNPVLLARYLSDLYLKNRLWGVEEARAFAAYLLWETKEYDPTVGKQSDIVTFRRDRTASRMSYEELSYWEDHFRVLKREMGILPPAFMCDDNYEANLRHTRCHGPSPFDNKNTHFRTRENETGKKKDHPHRYDFGSSNPQASSNL